MVQTAHFAYTLNTSHHLSLDRERSSDAFTVTLKTPSCNGKGNSLCLSLSLQHPQGCTHSTAYQSISNDASRIIQLAQGPLMILKIKEDNASLPLLPLGAVFLLDQVAVMSSPPSIIIRVLLFIIIH